MLTLKNILPSDYFGQKRLEYEIEHQTIGRDGTTLKESLVMESDDIKTTLKLNISDCSAPTQKEALDKLASWLRRLADGLENRKQTTIEGQI